MADGIGWWFDADPTTHLPAYGGADLRRLVAVLVAPSTSLLARPGRRPGGGLEVTVGGSPEAASIAPGGGIITDAAGGGSFIFVIPSTVAINLATRPSSGNSRLDEVVAVVKNVDARPADGTREIDLQVITGTAGSSPTAPTVPTGALRLAELAVPASGAVSVSKAPQRIAALGGILPVANQAERDAIEVPYDGQMVYREDTDLYEGRINGAWTKFITDNGHRPADVREGLTSGVGLNSSGQATVSHGGSTAPSFVTADVEGTIAYKAFANSPTSSGFQVTVKDMASGAVVASTSVAIKWRAVWL